MEISDFNRRKRQRNLGGEKTMDLTQVPIHIVVISVVVVGWITTFIIYKEKLKESLKENKKEQSEKKVLQEFVGETLAIIKDSWTGLNKILKEHTNTNEEIKRAMINLERHLDIKINDFDTRISRLGKRFDGIEISINKINNKML
jgi:hypothetical protein